MSRRRVVTTRRADEDIEAAVDHHVGEGAVDAALDFITALQAASDLLARHPAIGSTRFATDTGIDELRALAVRTFPYVVFYTDDADAVRVHRLLHASRDMPAHATDD